MSQKTASKQSRAVGIGWMLTVFCLAGGPGDAAEPAAAVVELDLGVKQTPQAGAAAGNAAEAAVAQGRPALVAVVATGVGDTPEAARQNAFSNAIEQVVGALVEAETIVKNDQLVRDQVLTYSRGYVEKFDVIGSWEKDGLHYCRIRADVSAEKLGQKLQTVNVALREVPGQLFALQLIQEQLSEEAAKQMFRKATADFTPDKVLKLAVVGKPDVERTAAGAKLTVHYTVSADLDAWQNIHPGVQSLLKRVCAASTTAQFTNGDGWRPAGKLPVKAVRGGDVVSHLYSGKSPEGKVTYWDSHLLPKWLQPEIAALAARQRAYQVRIALLDQADQIVAEARDATGIPALVPSLNFMGAQFLTSSIAPLPYSSRAYEETKELTHDFRLTVDQLGRVAKCAALWTQEPAR
jgi:hypothetical protein